LATLVDFYFAKVLCFVLHWIVFVAAL
jgi:hypothetical protein